MVIATSASMRLNVDLKICCVLGAIDDNETYGAEDLAKLLKVCNIATLGVIIANVTQTTSPSTNGPLIVDLSESEPICPTSLHSSLFMLTNAVHCSRFYGGILEPRCQSGRSSCLPAVAYSAF